MQLLSVILILLVPLLPFLVKGGSLTVVVIGGGVSGLTATHELAERGYNVLKGV